jgi:hypothetical protein
MVNEWRIDTSPGMEHEVHFYAVNPLPEPAVVVLTLDTSDYPPGWFVSMSPGPGDTLLFYPNETRVVILALKATDASHCLGTVDVYETLLPAVNHAPCVSQSCDDTTCGGYVRVIGGCRATLDARITGVSGEGLSGGDALLSVEPSVFTSETRVELSLSAGAPADLAVYDVTGRLVRTLLRGSLSTGTHALQWDGRDDAGRSVPPACYFVRVEAGSEHAVLKIVRVK